MPLVKMPRIRAVQTRSPMEKRMMAMKCQVKDLEDKSKGEIELEDSVFAVEPRKDLLARTVNWQWQTPIRHARVKLVGDISGTTAKPFRQKGTGRARQVARERPVSGRGNSARSCCMFLRTSCQKNKKASSQECAIIQAGRGQLWFLKTLMLAERLKS